MSLRVRNHSEPVPTNAGESLDLLLGKVLDCVSHERDSAAKLRILLGTVKQHVLELAKERSYQTGITPLYLYPYRKELKELEHRYTVQKSGLGKLKGNMLLLLAMVFYRAGSLSRAMKMASQARGQFDQAGNVHNSGLAELLVTVCLMERNQLEQAALHCALSLKQLSVCTNATDAAQGWQIYSRVLYKQGKLDESIAALLMAYEIYRKEKSADGQIKALLAMTLVLISQKDWHGAIFRLKQALAACHEYRLPVLELEVLNLLTHLFLKTGQTVLMEGCQQRIREISEGIRH
ncbi:tetratricopeptide repeat protein [Effusibacillus lacus]|uniref:MalT-like TPR region domain-containing protein n=1 Tax=Effusibacillus lacus TaxID=1348429 RepID=A0A292YN19_9BACL|nr:hypothetical protein [Effusibacillus lacus]TCS77001.1 hypothetical protein EDD64_101226 [Effusibacillus lacus]GAX91328.1 hypothetical protein EFBL_2994 [Effusibacillus lacus]